LKSENPRHRPNRLDKYQNTHESYIDNFVSEGFIGEHTLWFESSKSGLIYLKGEIACPGQILIATEKTLKPIQGSGESRLVQTVRYQYNVSVRGEGNVFRYDNLHSRPGHPDDHHRHDFDWKRPSEKGEGKVTWVGECGWPTMDEVIEEAKVWYLKNKTELPEGYPRLGLR
jgi:hypothetical protein